MSGRFTKGLSSILLLCALWGCQDRDQRQAKAGEVKAGESLPRSDQRQVLLSPEAAAFYRERGFRPLWISNGALRPEARRVVSMVAAAGADGLDPERYDARRLAEAVTAAASGGRNELARAELLLSKAYADYLHDLHRPLADEATFYVDRELAPTPQGRRAFLDAAAQAPSLAAHLEEAGRMNPVYEGLRGGIARQRARGMNREQERIALANLERVRALPPNPGSRFIFVDTASARLWMFENGRVRGSMRVIVGKPGMESPAMAGLIRFAVLTPYWNVPPDLARHRIAPRVLREGARYLARERMQILSDWSDTARPIPASQVNWRAVASGKEQLRVRELPGPNNMMGAVKFMMPNRLGIYLHDTPNKASFALADRRLSSGCVRVQDAARLSRWLFGGDGAGSPSGAPEQRVDLPEPVPVYIGYLTALPGPEGLVFGRDSYQRDAALMESLKRQGRLS